MTKVTITVERPTNGFANLHGAIKGIPFGLCTSADAIPAGDNFQIILSGRKRNDTYTAANSFIEMFDGTIISAMEKTGKNEVSLL